MTEDTKRLDSTDSRQAPTSGAWLGYCLDGLSGQPFHLVMTLNFERGLIHGDGDDRAGSFIINGEFSAETGTATWTQRRQDSRSMDFRGFHENGQIWGVWRDSTGASGGFQIWPMSGGNGSRLTTREQIDAVASATSKVLSRFAKRRGVSIQQALDELFK